MATIIAELCQNHNGDETLLNEMVHAAAESGADYAKIQSMLADDLTFRERFETGLWEGDRQVAIKRPYQAEYDRLRPMDVDDDAHHRFIEQCRIAGIKPLTTAFSRSRIPFLSTLGFDAIKVASYDCASEPFLNELKPHFDHIYVSTGSTYDSEIEKAAQILGDHPFSFLHCVTIYPTPIGEMHLNRLDYLRRLTSSVGFSDHSLVARDGIKASAVAIHLGADVVERHFTILAPDESRDGPVSINPAQLAELVDVGKMGSSQREDYIKQEVGDFSVMMGSTERSLSETELLNRDYYAGRFASRVGDALIYNSDERPL
jgi:N,N'-diacetyllegionaminate synthase